MMTTSFASKYKVIQKIGEGSFSEVLKCEDKQTGAQYAAKRLKKIFKSITDVMSCAEIIAMHKLSRHPNVLYMIEYFYEPGSGKLVYVFELMDMSMYEFMKMRKRCLPETKIKNYLYQMLRGLEHLHKNGLFHRDIKPENILIKLLNPNSFSCNQIEVVKLADLGSIRGIYSRPPYTEYISTRWYRSPECLLSVGYYGPKMDIWAAGCVFYEMLTLKPLFPGTNEIDQLAKIHSVLGTPSVRLINRIKKKSHNCEIFPRQLASGLNPLINSFSDDAQNVIKLMVQYDPENRINVRRLVEHKYFTTLRDQYLVGQYQHTAFHAGYGDLQSKGRGDQMYFVNYIGSAEKCRQHQDASVNSVSHADKVPKAKKSPLVSSKTSTDMNGYNVSCKSKKHMLRETGGHLVTHRQFKEWGVDPTILKPKETANKSCTAKEHSIKTRNPHQKRNARANNAEPFRKTTSHLPVSKAGPYENSTSPSVKQQFQSKSFVLPRRVMGRIKLDTINECCSPMITRLTKHK